MKKTKLHSDIAFQKRFLEMTAQRLTSAIEALGEMEGAPNPSKRMGARRKVTEGWLALASSSDSLGLFLIDNDLQRHKALMSTPEMDRIIAAKVIETMSEARH